MARACAVAAAVMVMGCAAPVFADDLVPGPVGPPSRDFLLGFDELYQQLGREVMGWPLEPEHQAVDADAVQLTTRGLAVWRKGELPSFHDGVRTYVLQPVQTAASVASHDALERVVDCIIQRESRGYPLAVNRSSGASGLGQFLPSTWRTTPYANYSVFDPVANRAAVRWMLEVGRGREFVTIGGCR